MEREIDEEILKIDDVKSQKTLQKHMIKQFKKKYPQGGLNQINELQQDYTIFMNTWEILSDKGKGRRIFYENIGNFFQQIGSEKFNLKQSLDESQK